MYFKWSCSFPVTKAWTEKRETPYVSVKEKILNYRQFSFPWTLETEKPIPYSSVSCGWLQFLTEVFIFSWSIYKVSLAVSRWHLVQQLGGLPRLQTWVPHLSLSGLCPFFLLLSTQMKSCYTSQRASIMNDQGIRIPGVCVRVNQRLTEMYPKVWTCE